MQQLFQNESYMKTQLGVCLRSGVPVLSSEKAHICVCMQLGQLFS